MAKRSGAGWGCLTVLMLALVLCVALDRVVLEAKSRQEWKQNIASHVAMLEDRVARLEKESRP